MQEASGQPLSSLPRHTLATVLRRFIGPVAYERELCDVLCGAFATPSGGPLNAAQLLEEFSTALAPPHLSSPAVVSKVELRKIIVTWVGDRARPTGSPTGKAGSTSPVPPPALSSMAREDSRLLLSAEEGCAPPRVSPPRTYSSPGAIPPPVISPSAHSPSVHTSVARAETAAAQPLYNPSPNALGNPAHAPPPSANGLPPGPPPSPGLPANLAAAMSASAMLSQQAAREASSALTSIIAQATAAAQEHERARTLPSSPALTPSPSSPPRRRRRQTEAGRGGSSERGRSARS